MGKSEINEGFEITRYLSRTMPKGINDDDYSSFLNQLGFYDKNQIEHFTKFSKVGYYDQSSVIGKGPKEFIFFTKPDLHLYQPGSNNLNPELKDDFFINCASFYKPIMLSLQSSASGSSGPFIPLLTNKVKSTLDLPSISATEMETAENIYGDAISYRLGGGEAYNSHTFSLDFEDTKYLDVYILFKIWEKYCDAKAKGYVTPPKDSYISNKILHDQIAVYKFILDDDYSSIIHYSKLTGVYPKEVPLATFSSLDENVIKHTVEFHAQYVEDMEPSILYDFNSLVKGKGEKASPDVLDGKWVRYPYISSNDSSKFRHRYKLKWRE